MGKPSVAPRKAGRRSKLTTELRKEICDLIGEGSYAVVAAQAVGIAESTYYLWKRRGQADLDADETTIYSEFSQSLKKAECEVEMKAVACVLDAAENGKWVAAMTFLERRWPQRWSRGERREHSVAAEPVAVDWSRLTPDELKLARELTAKCRPTQ